MSCTFCREDLARVARVELDQRSATLRIYLDDGELLKEKHDGGRSEWFASTNMELVGVVLVGLLEALTGYHFQLESYGKDKINPSWARTNIPCKPAST